MRIDVYLDDDATPLRTVTPPERFEFDSTRLEDGPHRLRFRARDEQGAQSERAVDFHVRNGPAIAVHGVVDGDSISGAVPILVNAYGANVGDEFEPMRIETPAPVPTWAWVLCLAILGWAVGYVSLEVSGRPSVSQTALAGESEQVARVNDGRSAAAWRPLGEQVYGNNCATCHQLSGEGLPGVFPPLKGSPAVLADDPTEHIRAVLYGMSGKVIAGVSYPAPMPPFGPLLTDEQVAAVVNHERRAWGNRSSTITAAEVAAQR